MTLAPGTRLGSYEITAKLGEGGMGSVWRATDTKLGRDVALKVLPESLDSDPDRRARFGREARSLAAMNHPNIATLYGVEEIDGRDVLVMELVEGEGLDEMIAGGLVPVERAILIGRQIADALAAAHDGGIVHRDLKPANVMLRPDGTVKVLDFGLAKDIRPPVEADSAATLSTHTALGTVVGTPAYMAPEQVRGEAVDHRADVFAFGCLLYELLTGERAFRRSSSIETLSAVLTDEPPPPSRRRHAVTTSLDNLVARCLEKEPARRPASGGELREQLTAVGRDLPADDSNPDRSLAVLPFTDISAEHDQGYFCDGLAEELLNSLARIRGLRVASRMSSFQFKALAVDAREIGERLGVGAILEGSVRKAGTRLRISVQLVDSTTGYQRWAERYDRELEDVFEIQDEIARRIVEALEVRLTGGELGRTEARGTPDPRAFDLYLRGRSFFYRGTRRDFEFAQELFRQAIELDSRYASPWAGIADCSSQIFREFDRRREHLDEAQAAAEHALALDPNSAPAHAALGFAQSLAGEREAAEEAFRRATRLDPHSFEAWYLYASELVYGWGEAERAAALFERAVEVDGSDFQSWVTLAAIHWELGHQDEARKAARRGLQLARAQLKLNPGDLRALYMSAQSLAVLGDREPALELAGRVRELDGNRTGLVLENLAEILVLVGRHDEALTCLENAVAQGFRRETAYRFAPFLAPLRAQPRFQALLDSMNELATTAPATTGETSSGT